MPVVTVTENIIIWTVVKYEKQNRRNKTVWVHMILLKSE